MVQRHIARPLLYEGRKAHIKFYILVYATARGETTQALVQELSLRHAHPELRLPPAVAGALGVRRLDAALLCELLGALSQRWHAAADVDLEYVAWAFELLQRDAQCGASLHVVRRLRLLPLADGSLGSTEQGPVYELAGALRPLARAREDAEAAAVADLRRRAPRLYQLGMPPDAARRMSRALEEEAGAWEWRRAEERRRADVARVLRAAVVSTVYAASGGSLMAPVLASLGVLGARGERVKRE